MKRLNILLGSGFSIAAGYPTVWQITDKVLTVKDVYKAEGAFYYKQNEQNEQNFWLGDNLNIVEDIQNYLEKLSDYVSGTFLNQYTYEDLAYFNGSIKDALSGEYENPLYLRLLEDIRSRDILNPQHNENDQKVLHFFQEVQNYIRWIVTHELTKENTEDDFKNIEPFLSGILSYERVNFFTLNHDLLLEDFLRGRKISYSDGFIEFPGSQKFRCFQSSFDEWPEKVHIYKLHGSINWRFYTADDINNPDFVLGISEQGDEVRDDSGNSIWQCQTYLPPEILVGTFNKILDYSNSTVHMFMQHFFLRELYKSDTLIVIGYGFMDKGINHKLYDWLSGKRERKIIVIDPSDFQNARGLIRRNKNNWCKRGQWLQIQAPMEEVAFLKLSEKLHMSLTL